MSVEAPIYLDHHATTPCDPAVVEAMLPWLTRDFGNAASRAHTFGWSADAAVERARRQVAALIGASPKEIVFTSGATEANNLALKGVAETYAARGRHLVTCTTEHKAVLDPCDWLVTRGFEVTRLGVGADGLLDLADLEAALRPDTLLVSVMAANNEIGTLAPLERIGALCRARGVFFHTDAAQAAGKVPLDVHAQRLDLVSFTAHKLYGPKGIGALYVRRRDPQVRLTAQMHGGGHERGLRSGTLPVHQIVGFGEACALAATHLEADATRLSTLRDRLWAQLREVPGARLNGAAAPRLPGNLNVSFDGVEAEALLIALRPVVALSSGAACASATLEPSHVLRALGLDEERAHGSLRFGLGRGTTDDDVERVATAVVRAVEAVRRLAS
ncbi:MAG: aminotransferase class V-fold PLP-dependent enzyme [Bradymonadia bacterium]